MPCICGRRCFAPSFAPPMDLQSLLQSLLKTDGLSLSASVAVMTGNLVVIGFSSWGWWRTRRVGFLLLCLAALGATLLVLADYLFAPQIQAIGQEYAVHYRWFRVVAFALLAGLRAAGVALVAVAFVRGFREAAPPPLVPAPAESES